MKQTLLMILGLGFLGPLSFGRELPADYKKAGSHEVTATRLDWKDERRNREVPVKVYAPKDSKGAFPVIIFSHGLGGTRDGYEYLGRHWASHGYVSVHLQHKGSDDAVWKGSKDPLADMRKAVKEPANALNRRLDVRFALDQLEKLNRDDPAFKGRLDLDHVGMAGHSFGGWTTQAIVGETFPTPVDKDVTMGDARVKAGIIMSPVLPPGKTDLKRAFGPIKVPCLHMTGTKDDSLGIVDVKPSDRRLPYDNMKLADQYLVIFKDGDHMIFAGDRHNIGDGSKDPLFHDLIRPSTTAFWDVYLKGDAKAKAWLGGNGFRKMLGENGTFEQKKGVPK